MPLLETLIVSVGPTIAKSILGLWLKDSEIASDISKSFVDVIAAQTNDVVARQRAKRQFEEIGEKVAISLEPLFREASIDEGGRNAVAIAVAETLDSTSLSAELLVDYNLDPDQLSQHLLNSNPTAADLFSSDETSLYERIISESCQYIVDISSRLPSFTERTFAELLSRDTQILDTALEILAEVQKIREATLSDPNVEAREFETAFRRAIIRNLDRMELFGASVELESRRHPLSIAYITLSVEMSGNGSSVVEGNNADASAYLGKERVDELSLTHVDEALSQSRCSLILGPAGSGKTTLLKWTAVRAAARNFPNSLSSWNDKIPFFIRLRQCVDTGLPAPEDFPSLVAPSIAGKAPYNWVHQRLESGSAIVLIDGVDEVAEGLREEVRVWIRDLVLAFPKAGFVVTSRPYAVTEGWIAREGFDQFELQPMEMADIRAFIDHWHESVSSELKEGEIKDMLPEMAAALKVVIANERSLRNLATSPLLCAMLCALHKDRARQLPRDRIELYDACCHMLLERREIERRVSLDDYPKITYRHRRVILEDLAYHLLVNGWSEVSEERAQNRIRRRIESMEGLPSSVTEKGILRFFVERSGMLREPADGSIDFTHRTFQEFLAAKASLDEGDVGLLIQNGSDDQWRETIILAAGLASRKGERAELINGLIQRGDSEESNRHQLHLLAIACLETVTDLEPSLKRELNYRLERLVPPTNMTEAKSLASAGELAVPQLAHWSNERATTVAAVCPSFDADWR